MECKIKKYLLILFVGGCLISCGSTESDGETSEEKKIEKPWQRSQNYQTSIQAKDPSTSYQIVLTIAYKSDVKPYDFEVALTYTSPTKRQQARNYHASPKHPPILKTPQTVRYVLSEGFQFSEAGIHQIDLTAQLTDEDLAEIISMKLEFVEVPTNSTL